MVGWLIFKTKKKESKSIVSKGNMNYKAIKRFIAKQYEYQLTSTVGSYKQVEAVFLKKVFLPNLPQMKYLWLRRREEQVDPKV